MAEAMRLGEFVAMVNRTQDRVRFEIRHLFPGPGRFGGTYIACGGDEYPLGYGVGAETLIDVGEQEAILNHFGQHDLLELFQL